MQETFDKVVHHLFTQGKQAKEGDTCLYRGPNGTMCAVGCRIPDELYDPSFEDERVQNLPIPLPDLPLLSTLQTVHDLDSSWTSRAELYDRLWGVATYFDLNTDALTEAYKNAHW